MEKPTCSNMEAFRQTKPTAQEYFGNAIDILDEEYGVGYAKKNPHLVAALINAQVSDFNNCAMVAANYEIAEGLQNLGDYLDK